MKKIILFSGIIALAFTACKKAEVPVNPASASASVSSAEQGKELIKKTDPDLCNHIYNSTAKTTDPSVILCPGSYVFTGGDASQGTCLSTNGVCFVVVIFNTLGTTTTLTSNYSASYAPNTAQMNLYTSPSQQFYIKSLNTTFSNGNASVHMVRQ